ATLQAINGRSVSFYVSGKAARRRGLFYALTNQPPTPTNTAPSASIQRPSLGMNHTAERIAQAAHIIRRIPSQQERERIMQQLEEDGDFTAEGIKTIRMLTQHL
ncbi:MAG: hypothetical protein L7S67_02785, partial [Flavobacteriales bacterium]|nr:hypothetical protein [Flavobacteriales bacterium]